MGEEMAVLCDSVGVLVDDLCEDHWFSCHASCMVPNRSHTRLAMPFSFGISRFDIVKVLDDARPVLPCPQDLRQYHDKRTTIRPSPICIHCHVPLPLSAVDDGPGIAAVVLAQPSASNR